MCTFYNKNHGANVSKSFNCQGKLIAHIDKQKGQETHKLLPSTSQLCKSSAPKKKKRENKPKYLQELASGWQNYR